MPLRQAATGFAPATTGGESNATGLVLALADPLVDGEHRRIEAGQIAWINYCILS